MRDAKEYDVLKRRLEFDNWALLLDTGHLMNSCDGAYDEDSAIDSVLDIVHHYPDEMTERICAMHLQLSTTAGFRESIADEEKSEDESWDSFFEKAYRRASEIDQHRPFTSPRVKEIVEAVRPEFINHELMGGLSGNRFGDLRMQRSLFRRIYESS